MTGRLQFRPALQLIALAALVGCGGGGGGDGGSTGDSAAAVSYDGVWSGTTSQDGRSLAFVVKNNEVVSGSIEYLVSGGACSVDGSVDVAVSSGPGQPVSGGSFTIPASGGPVSLTGSGSFSSASSAAGTFTVTDPACGSASGTWTARPGNGTPRASAGFDSAAPVGSIVTLSGRGHDVNGDPLTPQWQFSSMPTGSAASLTNANTMTPSFTPDLAGAYVLALVVGDGQVSSAPSTVTVTATATASLDGNWSGVTGQGRPFSFAVSGHKLASITLDYAASSCGSTTTSTVTFDPPLAVSSDLNYRAVAGLIRELTGTLDPSGSGSGSLTLRHEDFGLIPPCFQTITTTWSATRS